MSAFRIAIWILMAVSLAASTAFSQASFEDQRAVLIDEIERHVLETQSYTGKATLAGRCDGGDGNSSAA